MTDIKVYSAVGTWTPGVLKRWTGSSWVNTVTKVWNGTAWVAV